MYLGSAEFVRSYAAPLAAPSHVSVALKTGQRIYDNFGLVVA